MDFGVYFKLGKKSSSKPTWFFFEFELDFYCLCSLQKSISKSNWFFSFLNLIFWNWKKFEWHSISQKSSGDRQGVFILIEIMLLQKWFHPILYSLENVALQSLISWGSFIWHGLQHFLINWEVYLLMSSFKVLYFHDTLNKSIRIFLHFDVFILILISCPWLQPYFMSYKSYNWHFGLVGLMSLTNSYWHSLSNPIREDMEIRGG